MTDSDIKAGLALCEAATAKYPDASCHGCMSCDRMCARQRHAEDRYRDAARTLLPEALRELERLRRVERAARDLTDRLAGLFDEVDEYMREEREERVMPAERWQWPREADLAQLDARSALGALRNALEDA